MRRIEILNQDHDELVKADKGELAIVPVFGPRKPDECLGFNIYAGDAFIGTFDSLNEAAETMDAILSYEGEAAYVCPGYSDYDMLEELTLSELATFFARKIRDALNVPESGRDDQ